MRTRRFAAAPTRDYSTFAVINVMSSAWRCSRMCSRTSSTMRPQIAAAVPFFMRDTCTDSRSCKEPTLSLKPECRLPTLKRGTGASYRPGAAISTNF